MVHSHSMTMLKPQQITTDFYLKLLEPMELTPDQKTALAQRVYDEFGSFIASELEY